MKAAIFYWGIAILIVLASFVFIVVSSRIATASMNPAISADINVPLYSKSITGLRLLCDLGNGNYLVEISVKSNIEGVLRPGKDMLLGVPHVVIVTAEEFSRLYKIVRR